MPELHARDQRTVGYAESLVWAIKTGDQSSAAKARIVLRDDLVAAVEDAANGFGESDLPDAPHPYGTADLSTLVLSPWFDGSDTPHRPGKYRVLVESVRCSCCWFDAHWDGVQWHTESMLFPGVMRVLTGVRQWRGILKKGLHRG